MQNQTFWIGLVVAVLLCGCALQEDVYTLDHRLSALERRNLALEKQNRELEQRNQDLLKAKETISSRVEGLDKIRQDDEMQLREQYATLVAQTQSLREQSQSLSGRLEEVEYLLEQKLKRFEDNQQKNRERMDRLATDTAALQRRINTIDQYLNLEGTPSGKPAASAPKTDVPATPASDQALYLLLSGKMV